MRVLSKNQKQAKKREGLQGEEMPVRHRSLHVRRHQQCTIWENNPEKRDKERGTKAFTSFKSSLKARPAISCPTY